MSPHDLAGKLRKATAPLFAILATTFFLSSASQDRRAKQISGKNFEIAGLTLGVSTDQDTERVLGRASATDTPDHEGARRCYLSASGDGTILEIESWFGSLIRFRIEHGRSGMSPPCAQSPLVSDTLATGAGLKLGLARNQIFALLGRPTSVHGSRLIYEESFDRPPTPEEERRLKEKGGPPWDVKSIHIEEKIDIVLSGSRVASLDVLHNETD